MSTTRRTFSLDEAQRVLAATPGTLAALLAPFPDDWTRMNEGGESWSPRDVVAHLVHGERTDWMPRVHHLRRHGDRVPFPPFDRTAHLSTPATTPLAALLDEFADLRRASLADLDALHLGADDLDAPGLHPALGPVTLQQLLATWMVHDLDHVMQITRVLATPYTEAVGPWREYLRIVREPVDK
jgi:hypothetical protein